MRRIVSWTGAVVVGAAALMLPTLSLNAGRHGGGGFRGGSFHASGGAGGYAHVGSVHYGGRTDSVPAGPVVHPGMVRTEHYEGLRDRDGWGGAGWGGYRSPYRDDYFRRFPPGYRSLVLGDALYYIYDNLPLGCPPVVLNGMTYYYCNGVYYQPYIYGGQTVYLVPPV